MQCVEDENSEDVDDNDDDDEEEEEEEYEQNLNKIENSKQESQILNASAKSLHYEKLSVPMKSSLQNSTDNQHNSTTSTKKIDHRLILNGEPSNNNDECFSEYADMSSISTLEPLSINTNFTCSINNAKSPKYEYNKKILIEHILRKENYRKIKCFFQILKESTL